MRKIKKFVILLISCLFVIAISSVTLVTKATAYQEINLNEATADLVGGEGFNRVYMRKMSDDTLKLLKENVVDLEMDTRLRFLSDSYSDTKNVYISLSILITYTHSTNLITVQLLIAGKVKLTATINSKTMEYIEFHNDILTMIDVSPYNNLTYRIKTTKYTTSRDVTEDVIKTICFDNIGGLLASKETKLDNKIVFDSINYDAESSEIKTLIDSDKDYCYQSNYSLGDPTGKYYLSILAKNEDNTYDIATRNFTIYSSADYKANPISISYKEEYDEDDFINALTLNASYKSITIESDYFNNKNKLGSYDYTAKVALNDGNVLNLTSTITVYDNDKPIINGPSSIAIYNTTCITKSDILSYYTLVDEFDGDVTESSSVIGYDNYAINYNKPGQYNLTIKAVDSSGNEESMKLILIVDKLVVETSTSILKSSSSIESLSSMESSSLSSSIETSISLYKVSVLSSTQEISSIMNLNTSQKTSSTKSIRTNEAASNPDTSITIKRSSISESSYSIPVYNSSTEDDKSTKEASSSIVVVNPSKSSTSNSIASSKANTSKKSNSTSALALITSETTTTHVVEETSRPDVTKSFLNEEASSSNLTTSSSLISSSTTMNSIPSISAINNSQNIEEKSSSTLKSSIVEVIKKSSSLPIVSSSMLESSSHLPSLSSSVVKSSSDVIKISTSIRKSSSQSSFSSLFSPSSSSAIKSLSLSSSIPSSSSLSSSIITSSSSKNGPVKLRSSSSSIISSSITSSMPISSSSLLPSLSSILSSSSTVKSSSIIIISSSMAEATNSILPITSSSFVEEASLTSNKAYVYRQSSTIPTKYSDVAVRISTSKEAVIVTGNQSAKTGALHTVVEVPFTLSSWKTNEAIIITPTASLSMIEYIPTSEIVLSSFSSITASLVESSQVLISSIIPSEIEEVVDHSSTEAITPSLTSTEQDDTIISKDTSLSPTIIQSVIEPIKTSNKPKASSIAISKQTTVEKESDELYIVIDIDTNTRLTKDSIYTYLNKYGIYKSYVSDLSSKYFDTPNVEGKYELYITYTDSTKEMLYLNVKGAIDTNIITYISIGGGVVLLFIAYLLWRKNHAKKK